MGLVMLTQHFSRPPSDLNLVVLAIGNNHLPFVVTDFELQLARSFLSKSLIKGEVRDLVIVHVCNVDFAVVGVEGS